MNTFPGASWIVAAVFALCGAVTVGGALLAVSSHRVIRSVSGLALGSLGLAGLYYFLHSPFLALMEILIYIGAVCVTIVFAVMLAEPDEPPPEQPRPRARWETVAALAVSVAVGGALAWLGWQTRWPAAPARPPGSGSVESLGVALLSTWCLAFELISLVLLLAILGALVLARHGRSAPPPAS